MEEYGYNAVGNLVSRKDFNAKVTGYQHDIMNRLTQTTPDAGLGEAPISYTYNVLGQRLTMTDGHGTTSYAYHPFRSWLTGKATPEGNITNTYNAVGNLLTTKSSNAQGTDVEYRYDALNRLETVTDHRLGTTQNVTSYGYDLVGNLETVTLPNGVESTYSYDVLNRLTNLTARNAGNTPVASYAYTLGAAGNRLSVAELSGRTTSWTYDALYRLTSETIAGATASQNGSIGYTFDAVGNRTNRNSTVAAVPTQANVQVDNNDRLTSDTYDANGNTTVSNGKQYEYDFMNRLLKVEGGGTTIDLVYDGDGNRVSKTVTTGGNSTTTSYLVDTNNHTGYSQVVEELQSGNVTTQYTYGHDLISSRTLTPEPRTRFFGYDGHGSTRYLTDANGTVTDTYDYDAFGNLIGQTGTTPNLYLYCGEQFDPDLGLYFLRARYLDVNSGRFWTQDNWEGNKEAPLSLHKYLYGNTNPVNSIDPSGESTLLVVLGVVAIVLTIIITGPAPGSGLRPSPANARHRKTELEFYVRSGKLKITSGLFEPVYEIPVTSGKGECVNDPGCDNIERKGPTPSPFMYEIFTPVLYVFGEHSFLYGQWINLKADWGSFYVPVTPLPRQSEFPLKPNGAPRDGIYLHGGRFTGSAGCIDTGGGANGNRNTARLIFDLRNDEDGVVPLNTFDQ